MIKKKKKKKVIHWEYFEHIIILIILVVLQLCGIVISMFSKPLTVRSSVLTCNSVITLWDWEWELVFRSQSFNFLSHCSDYSTSVTIV